MLTTIEDPLQVIQYEAFARHEGLTKMIEIPDEICWFGDPVLRKKAESFTENEINNGEHLPLIQKMVEVLKATNLRLGLGRALAAAQIGVPRRLFVTFDRATSSWQAYLNPRILAVSDDTGVYREMCLSAVPLTGEVRRSWEIEFEYYDQTGNYHRVSADPFLSRVAQHEIDHLEGILFVDRMELKTISFAFDFDAYKSSSKLEKCK